MGWDEFYLHIFTAGTWVPTAASTDAALAEEPDTKFYVPFDVTDSGTKVVHVHHVVYTLTPLYPILLCGNLIYFQLWMRLCSAIATVGLEYLYKVLIDWMHVVLIHSGTDAHSLLILPSPMSPLVD